MGIFLVGLSEAFARSLARYTSADRRVVLIGAAPSLALARMLVPATAPDVVLLLFPLLAGSSGELVQELRTALPGLRIVCVADDPQAYRSAAAQAGADAVISKCAFASDFDALLGNLYPGHAA